MRWSHCIAVNYITDSICLQTQATGESAEMWQRIYFFNYTFYSAISIYIFCHKHIPFKYKKK